MGRCALRTLVRCVRTFDRVLGIKDGNACGYCATGSLWMHRPRESGMHSTFAKDDVRLRVEFTCDVARVMG